ncbi:hypothetical protein [Vitiosangium sp. GDMCC 1.1324]|uniref:hypothetical protein n=1 Tax=Vitiosangium sp. (strain GDMCC 1.1324) TaxID=2138576 RepID=UPI001E50D874|nr:hypothetical protein [Vitiosangium sp. GDMCC 1.1324]
MLKPYHFIPLVLLSIDGGTVALQPDSSASGVDAGTADAGIIAPPPNTADSIRWPENLRPLATLDGPAVLAANAALQRVLSRVPKEYAGTCEYSAESMDVVIGQEGGLYFVRIDRRADRCGWAPGFNLEFDWFELYAVSPQGRVLARYPYMP